MNDTTDGGDGPPPDEPAEVLTERDWSAGVDMPQVDLRRAISNAMVGLKKRYFGKGPVQAKTYIHDQFVFCVLEGGLTRSEETLIAAGQAADVREYRLKFEAAVADTATAAVEQITGRRVVNYHSQILFEPTYGIEIFILDGPLHD